MTLGWLRNDKAALKVIGRVEILYAGRQYIPDCICYSRRQMKLALLDTPTAQGSLLATISAAVVPMFMIQRGLYKSELGVDFGK